MIYTSYFANLRRIPSDIVPIAICGKVSSGYNGLCYKKLAPKYWFFKIWKENHDNDFYVKHFHSEVLDKLDADEVVDELMKKSGGKDIVLICYEKPNDFCHRHLVCEWLRDNGYMCEEY